MIEFLFLLAVFLFLLIPRGSNEQKDDSYDEPYVLTEEELDEEEFLDEILFLLDDDDDDEDW